MSRTKMSRTATSSACLFSIILLAGCQTTNSGAPPNYAVPSNYRQLVAGRVAHDVPRGQVLRRAMISQPAEGWAGLVGGGKRPMVCAETTSEGGIIPHFTRYLFFFENGQIASTVVNPGAIYCMNVPVETFLDVAQRASAAR